MVKSMFQFEKIQKLPSYRLLADAVTQQVLDGQLKVGDALPTEAQLCETFGVNRSTVREAIRVLEQSNLLRRESAKRRVICHPSHGDIDAQFERICTLQEIPFEELMEAVLMIEPSVVRLAAVRASERQLDELTHHLGLIELALAGAQPLADLNTEFGNIVARMSGNRALMLARAPLGGVFYQRFQELVFERVKVAGKRMVEARRSLLDALRRGDPDDAEKWMRKQIDDFERGYGLARRKVAADDRGQAFARR